MDRKKVREELEAKFKNVKWAGHPCGKGSIFENTTMIRTILPEIVMKFDIHSISDAGAGDLSWLCAIKWPHEVDYKAYDIYPRHEDVIEFDVVTEVLPATDLILCRHVLNHLPGGLNREAVLRFNESGSKYILISFDRAPNESPWHEEYWGKPVIPYLSDGDYSKRNWHYGLWELSK